MTSPNFTALENVEVLATDPQFNPLDSDVTDVSGRYSIDSLAVGKVNLIFTHLNNFFDKDTVYNVILPTRQDKIQQGTLIYLGPSLIDAQESDTIWVQHADYFYPGLGLNHLEVDNTADWEHVITLNDSSGYRTVIQNFNGSLPLIIRAVSNGGTEKIVSTPVNIEDMVNLSGGIYDNDFYLKLVDGSTGPPLAGYVKESATGQKIYTTNGLFTLRIPATSNVTLKGQHIIGTDTLSFEPSFDFDASQDIF